MRKKESSTNREQPLSALKWCRCSKISSSSNISCSTNPHSATTQLYHSEHERLPHTIKFFAGAYTLMNNFWSNPTNIHSYLTQHGHKSWFIQTVIAHVASLGDYFKLWQRHVIQSPHVAMSALPLDERIGDPVQSRFMGVFKLLL